MAKVNNTFINGRMNSDLTYSLLDNKDFVHAENLRIIGVGDDGRFNFLKGSQKISDYSENGQMTVVGMYEGDNNKLYYFLAQPNGKSKIIEYDVETKESKIIIQDNRVLRFDFVRWKKGKIIFPLKYILNINQIGDLLLFSNEAWEYPRVINLKRDYSLGFTEEDIVLAKKPPKEAPKILSTGSRSSSSNDDSDVFVSFAYRYKYLDGDYSALSFYTDIAFTPHNFHVDARRENKGMTNIFGSIQIGVNSGGKNVTDIEVYAREHGSNTAYLIYSINKAQSNISDNAFIYDIQYKFSKNYEVLNEEATNMLFSNMPKFPKTQTAVGNRIIFGNYFEGYDVEPINFKVDKNQTDGWRTGIRTSVSLHKYKVGVVYYNDYNESTTVLLPNNQSDSEVEIGFEDRLKANRLQVTIPHTYNHPLFATKMKFVVKSESLDYEILYSTYAKKIGRKVYLYLIGDNVNRVRKGDVLIRTDEDASSYKEYHVEEVKMFDAKDGFSLSGLYAVIHDDINSIRIQSNGNTITRVYGETGRGIIDAVKGSKDERRYYATSGYQGKAHGKYDFSSYHNKGSIFKGDIGRIYEGDELRLSIKLTYGREKHGRGDGGATVWGTIYLNQTVYASQNYDSIADFLNENLETSMLTAVDSGQWCDILTTQDYVSLVKTNIPGWDWSPHEDNRMHKAYVKSQTSFTLHRGNKPLIFRTKSKGNLEAFYYETPKTYPIVNGRVVPDSYNSERNLVFDIDFYNGYSWGNGIESYRIKDGFNAKAIRNKFRVNNYDKKGYKRIHRKNDVTYSGVYNYELGINELSTFNPSLANWLTLPIRYGEIQRIIAMDGNITAFQNNKVVDVFYGKSIIADLQGNESLGLSKDVLGGYKELPYEYGISENPESVITAGQLIYFTDKNRSRFLVKAGNEIQELNTNGFYREGVELLKNNQSFLGSFDDANGEYVVVCSRFEDDRVKSFSLAHSMVNKGFTSYYTYLSDFNFGMNGKYFSSYKGAVYQNEVTDVYNDFTGQGLHEAKLTFVVNPDFSTDKVFKAIYLQSNTAWNTKMRTNLTATSFSEKVYEKRESYFYTDIHRDNSSSLGIVGIGTIKNIQGNTLIYKNSITNQVSVGETLQNEAANVETVITNIQDNEITVMNSSGLNVGDFTFAKKKQEGHFRPSGVPMRGEWLEVTLTKIGNQPYYITATNTEVIPSKL